MKSSESKNELNPLRGFACLDRDSICGSKSRKGDAAGKPKWDGPMLMFGVDDDFIASFEDKAITVVPFDDAMSGGGEKTGRSFKLEFTAVKAVAAGRRAPKTLFAIDTRGDLWSVSFDAGGELEEPRVDKLADCDDAPIDDIVALRRRIILQRRGDRGEYSIESLDRRSGKTEYVGTFKLEPELAALDSERFDLLIGRRQGEIQLLAPEGAGSDEYTVEPLPMERLTAATVLSGTHLVFARKGGHLNKVDMRAVSAVAVAPDPYDRICYALRAILKRCGCDCNCDGDGKPGDSGGDDRPGQDEPCDDRHSAKLGFTAYHLYRSGAYIVATDRSVTRMAVLDDRLNILLERKVDRGGARVMMGQPHTQRFALDLPRKAQLEAWALDDYVASLVPRLPDHIELGPRLPASSVTYWGQRHSRALANPTVKVCLFPVIEPGQAYNDADMTKLIDQVSAKIFTKVDDYYDENSFGEVAMDFTTFGHDIGGNRKPLVLPNAMASYWWETYRGGGLTAVMPADWANPIAFDGTEALEIQANPRAGAVKSYDLPFAAMWTSVSAGSFPVDINFDGSETLQLTIETQAGDAEVLDVNFPAANFTVNQGDDIGAFLTDLGNHVTAAIRTAEAALPGSPTLVQDMVFRRFRSSSDDTQFGQLQAQFRIEPSAPAAVTQKGRVSITTPGAVGQALSDAGLVSGASRSGEPTSAFQVRNYFREVLRAAQVDAGEGIDANTEYFNTTVTTDEDTMAQELTVNVNLSRDTGGEFATMEVLSSTGLGGTGWDTAAPNPGSASNPNNTNALKDIISLADDTFTAALEHLRATTAWNRSAVEAMFDDFDVMMIAHVGAPHPGIPAADQWSAADPVDFANKRMYARGYFARDTNPPGGEDPVQMGTRTIIGQKFASFGSAGMNSEAGVMAHELGHALGLPDLYPANGYRDDVMYISPWAMMGGGNGNFHHFCGWSKWKLGWVADDPDPNINRTIFVDMPGADSVTQTDAWLVPIEYWDNAMRQDVRDEVGGATEIGQLMKLNIGSDGGVTAFLELRARGDTFSQNLNPQPTVIASNGLDPDSDQSWAVNGKYRRDVHLLNTGAELRATGDTWDFATAPEFPIKGCVAEVVDTRTVRGTIPVYRVRVTREQAEYVDLHFQDHVPAWKSPDIYVDWRANNTNPNEPRTYPVGTPVDQGEAVRFPSSGIEPHFVVARVHNGGNVRAEDVKVRWFVCDPPGAGDDGRWVNRGTETIPEVGPGDNEIVPFDWDVDSTVNAHQCLRMEIIDWTIPAEVDPATGDTVALASDDVKLQNNNAQQNVSSFEALAGSPYAPIDFPMQVHNDRLQTEVCALVPDNLPYGAKLTISPAEWAIPTGEARVFQCRLELDEAIIRPGCDNDSGFLLTALRRDEESDANWGSCFYHIRPRYKTKLALERGSWIHGQVVIHGHLSPDTETAIDLADDLPLHVQIRLMADGPDGGTTWHTVGVNGDGSFLLNTIVAESKSLVAQAWFDRTVRLGSSVSNELEVHHTVIK